MNVLKGPTTNSLGYLLSLFQQEAYLSECVHSHNGYEENAVKNFVITSRLWSLMRNTCGKQCPTHIRNVRARLCPHRAHVRYTWEPLSRCAKVKNRFRLPQRQCCLPVSTPLTAWKANSRAEMGFYVPIATLRPSYGCMNTSR